MSFNSFDIFSSKLSIVKMVKKHELNHYIINIQKVSSIYLDQTVYMKQFYQ